MMTKLTKRDKFLLYFLLCFLIVIIGYMLVAKPTVAKYNELKGEYDTMQARYKMMADVTKEVENLLKQSDDLDKLIATEMESFYKVLLPEDIDRTATDFLIRNGLVPVSFKMNDVSMQQVKPYDAIDTGDSVAFGTAYTCDVNFAFTGTQAQFEQILQDIDDAPQMQLVAFSQKAAKDADAMNVKVPERPGDEDEEEDEDEKKPEVKEEPAKGGKNKGNTYTIDVRLLMQNANVE